MKKIKYKDVVEILLHNGYKVLTPENEYVNTQENICCEKDGLKSWCSVCDILSKKSRNSSKRFFSMSNPFVFDNMRKYILNKDESAEILSIKQITKSKRKRTLLTIRCSCGKEFNRLWDEAKSATYPTKCNNCFLKLRGNGHRKDKEEALVEFANRGYKIIGDTSNFLRNEPIEVEDSNGYRGFLSYNKMHHGVGFNVFDIRRNESNYIYNANVLAKSRGIGTIVLGFCDEKKYTTRGIRCRCECGDEYITSIGAFTSGTMRCPKCAWSMSKYERMVDLFLTENNIDHISEYRINSCKDIAPLPFDFFVIDEGKLIEIDGQGHYKPCNFNQIGHDDAQKVYESTVKHDKIKNDYCAKYNIPLLRIPYWEMDDGSYKEKIMQFIKE